MAVAIGLNPALNVIDSNGATTNITLTGTSTAGSSVFLLITWTPLTAGTQTPMVVSSTGLTIDTDSIREEPAGTGPGYAIQSYIFSTHNVSSATDRVFVVTWPTGGGYGTVKIVEFTGLDTTPFEDASDGGGSGTNPTLATGTVVSSTNVALALATTGINSGANPSITGHPPTGWTSLGLEADQTAHMSGAPAYRIISSSGNYSASWGSDSTGADGTWSAVAALYTGTASGGGITGSGALTFPATTASGAGVEGHSGSGALTFPVTTASGAGVHGIRDVPGEVELTFPMPTISGSGVVNGGPGAITGDGALTFPLMVVDGDGEVEGSISGSGAANFPVPTISGVGVMGITGEGVLTFPAFTLNGTDAVAPDDWVGGIRVSYQGQLIYEEAAATSYSNGNPVSANGLFAVDQTL